METAGMALPDSSTTFPWKKYWAIAPACTKTRFEISDSSGGHWTVDQPTPSILQLVNALCAGIF